MKKLFDIERSKKYFKARIKLCIITLVILFGVAAVATIISGVKGDNANFVGMLAYIIAGKDVEEGVEDGLFGKLGEEKNTDTNNKLAGPSSSAFENPNSNKGKTNTRKVNPYGYYYLSPSENNLRAYKIVTIYPGNLSDTIRLDVYDAFTEESIEFNLTYDGNNKWSDSGSSLYLLNDDIWVFKNNGVEHTLFEPSPATKPAEIIDVYTYEAYPRGFYEIVDPYNYDTYMYMEFEEFFDSGHTFGYFYTDYSETPVCKIFEKNSDSDGNCVLTNIYDNTTDHITITFSMYGQDTININGMNYVLLENNDDTLWEDPDYISGVYDIISTDSNIVVGTLTIQLDRDTNDIANGEIGYKYDIYMENYSATGYLLPSGADGMVLFSNNVAISLDDLTIGIPEILFTGNFEYRYN